MKLCTCTLQYVVMSQSAGIMTHSSVLDTTSFATHLDKSNLVAIEPEFCEVSKLLQAFNQGYLIAVKVKLSE